MAEPFEQPFREFARELILRLDRLHRDLSAQTAELARQNDINFNQLNARLEEIQRDGRAHREALREDNAAHRQALLRILDRLDGGGTAPA